jgi:CRP/FNR family transcriptional regulator, cyclic AMP receptor protein
MVTEGESGLDAFRDAVLERGETRQYRPQAQIVQEGEPAESLYWIVSGELVAYVEDEEGHVFELSRMKPGEYFGELLFASARRTASVRTVTTSRLCRIGRPELERLLVEQPAIALEIIRMLSHRLAALTTTVRGIALSDVYSRLSRFLHAGARDEGGRRIVDGVSQQQMAERLGASRSMVNRLLKDLQAGGYVQIERRSIELLKPLPKRW